MPHQCVRCASELPDPLPALCPRCSLPVSKSLPPVEAQQAANATIDPQALADRDLHVVEQSGHSTAEQSSSASSAGDASPVLGARHMSVRRPLWLPLGIGALLSSLLFCGLVLVPLGPALALWGSGAANQFTQLIRGTPSRSATPTISKPYVFHDTLLRGNMSGWPTDSGHCFFADDGYHVKDGVICRVPIRAMANGTRVVTMRILAGRPEQGIFFRLKDQDNTYGVALAQSGGWSMGKVVDGETEIFNRVEHEDAIHTGLNVANTVEIIMRGDVLTISLNTIQVESVADASFSSGLIGLYATPGTEAVFSDVSAIADP
jgi:hypothetical protein